MIVHFYRLQTEYRVSRRPNPARRFSPGGLGRVALVATSSGHGGQGSRARCRLPSAELVYHTRRHRARAVGHAWVADMPSHERPRSSCAMCRRRAARSGGENKRIVRQTPEIGELKKTLRQEAGHKVRLISVFGCLA